MRNRIVYSSPDKVYRIVEHSDETAQFEDLCGDTFKPELHPEIPRAQILRELADFTDLVNSEGVYGYVLERWNPEPGAGYEHVDSCWGFVGPYDPKSKRFNHYIVDELMSQINKEGAQ